MGGELAVVDEPLLAAHIWRALAARTRSTAVLSPAVVAALATRAITGELPSMASVATAEPAKPEAREANANTSRPAAESRSRAK